MDKTFTALAERELKRRSCVKANDVEVLNFGVAGFGTAQELLLLRTRAWKFDPDMVVLQIYSGNDVFNNHRRLNVSTPDKTPYFLLNNGHLELDDRFRRSVGYNKTLVALKGIGADLLNSSTLLQMAYKLRLLYGQRAEQTRLTGQPADSSGPDALPPQYQRFLAYLSPTIPTMVEAWRVTEALLGEFYNEVRSRHVPLLLLITPTSHQIHYDPAEREAYRVKYAIDSLEYADKRVERHAHAHNIHAVRLSPALVEEAIRTRTFMVGFANTFPNEGHFNERGHIVIAREMVEAICAMTAGQSAPQTRAGAHFGGAASPP